MPIGRPRLYEHPEFEAYVEKVRPTLMATMRRSYVRTLIKILAKMGTAPTGEEAARVINGMQQEAGTTAQATWNLYVRFMLETQKVALPLLDRRGFRSSRFLLDNADLHTRIQAFWSYTDCSFEEIVNFTNKQIKFLTHKTEKYHTACVVIFPEPKRRVVIPFVRHAIEPDVKLREVLRDSFVDLRDRPDRTRYIFGSNWQQPDIDFIATLVRSARLPLRAAAVTPSPAQKTSVNESEFFENASDLALRQYVHDRSLTWAHVEKSFAPVCDPDLDYDPDP